jgi:predicted unusual protein kinase regulating ubiquinone biosynthesis (AarF/ABC1/UbiB family)
MDVAMDDGPKKRPRRAARVPEGRAERIARLGSMIAGIAGEAALEALRRAAGRGEDGSVVLTRANAQRLTETLADLRGAAMKLGQLLSLHGDDLLPPRFVEVLASLRDQAYVMPEAQVRSVLAEEFGPEWEARFAEFDFEPIAAASIGQVHAAQAADGRDLALKLQYPGVSRSISSDVDNLAVFLRVSRILPGDLDFETLIPEIKRELRHEANYHREADNTDRYRQLVADDPSVIVPRVHRDLSTRHILATDRIYALPIEELRSPEYPPELRDRTGTSLVALVFRELFTFRFMQTDPNFANYLFEPKEQRIALLDFGATRRFNRAFTEVYRRLIISAVEGDRRTLLDVAAQLGFLRQDQRFGTRAAFAELCELFTEPLRHPGPYNFAGSDLARRVRDRSLELLNDHSFVQPPPESLFLHRKLGGSFLLCAHIGASVDCSALYRELVWKP